MFHLVSSDHGIRSPEPRLKNGVPGHPKCQNDSMSFVDVRDCAAQHVAAMEMEAHEAKNNGVECMRPETCLG